MSPFNFILFACCLFESSGENILILHPIYCGSHEFVLRSLGDHLVQRGHQVTQVRFKQKNSHMELKTNVSVLTLNISDHLNNCARYVNDKGVLDISTVGAKILWDQGHSVFGLPLDINMNGSWLKIYPIDIFYFSRICVACIIAMLKGRYVGYFALCLLVIFLLSTHNNVT